MTKHIIKQSLADLKCLAIDRNTGFMSELKIVVVKNSAFMAGYYICNAYISVSKQNILFIPDTSAPCV